NGDAGRAAGLRGAGDRQDAGGVVREAEDVAVVAGDVVELAGVQLDAAAGVVQDRAGEAAELGGRLRRGLGGDDALGEPDGRAPAGRLAGDRVGAAEAGGVVDGHVQAAGARAADGAVVVEVDAVAVVHDAVAVDVGEEHAAELGGGEQRLDD